MLYPNDTYSDLQNKIIPILPKISGSISFIGSFCIIVSIISSTYPSPFCRCSRMNYRYYNNYNNNNCCDADEHDLENNNNNENNSRRIITSRKRQRNQNNNNMKKRTRRNRTTRQHINVQKRLLIGISLCDMIQSACHICSTWAIPKNTMYSFIKYNYGTQKTCTIQGFSVIYGGLSVPIYNASLCIFYLICVKFHHISDRKIATRIEPFMHLIAIVLPLLICSFCMLDDVYNPGWTSCHLVTYPRSCNFEQYNIECIRGEKATKYQLWCTAIVVTCFLIMSISLSILYSEVKKQERRIRRWSFQTMRKEQNNDNIHQQQQQQQKSHLSLLSHISAKPKSSTATRKTTTTTIAKRRRRKTSTKRVFQKALYYVIPFLLVWTPTFLSIRLSRVKNANPTWSFIVVLLVGIFAPLQGFFNAFVFFDMRIFRCFGSFKKFLSNSFSLKKKKPEIQGDSSDNDMNVRDNNIEHL